MPDSGRLSPWWRHGAILAMIFGFSVLSVVTVQTYRNAPPIPDRVVDESDRTVFTGPEILAGQEVFLKYGLMEHGTLWGHGAYLGPDYTAETLHRLAEVTQETVARSRHQSAYAELDEGRKAAVADETRRILRRNTFDAATKTITFSGGAVAAFETARREWAAYFDGPAGAPGLPAHYIRDSKELDALAAYFSWATWATVTNRPGKDYSYTNNFPYEPLVGNRPTSAAYLWSGLSLIALLGGLGTILFLFGKFDFLGWRAEAGTEHRHEAPKTMALTPSQKVMGWFLAVVAILFLLQTLAGGALAHYRVEPGSFYGFDLASVLPYTLLRTWHLQLAIFWIATAWVAGGLFLAPLLGGGDPKGQKAGALALLGALAVVVFGSLFGEFLGLRRCAREVLVLVRTPGLGVPRPGPLLAAPPRGGPRPLARPDVPGAPPGDEAPDDGHASPRSSSTSRSRSLSSTSRRSSTVRIRTRR